MTTTSASHLGCSPCCRIRSSSGATRPAPASSPMTRLGQYTRTSSHEASILRLQPPSCAKCGSEASGKAPSHCDVCTTTQHPSRSRAPTGPQFGWRGAGPSAEAASDGSPCWPRLGRQPKPSRPHSLDSPPATAQVLKPATTDLPTRTYTLRRAADGDVQVESLEPAAADMLIGACTPSTGQQPRRRTEQPARLAQRPRARAGPDGALPSARSVPAVPHRCRQGQKDGSTGQEALRSCPVIRRHRQPAIAHERLHLEAVQGRDRSQARHRSRKEEPNLRCRHRCRHRPAGPHHSGRWSAPSRGWHEQLGVGPQQRHARHSTRARRPVSGRPLAPPRTPRVDRVGDGVRPRMTRAARACASNSPVWNLKLIVAVTQATVRCRLALPEPASQRHCLIDQLV